MSTSELAYSPEKIQWLFKDTFANDSLSTIGEEGRELGICPYVMASKEIYIEVGEPPAAIERQYEKSVEANKVHGKRRINTTLWNSDYHRACGSFTHPVSHLENLQGGRR